MTRAGTTASASVWPELRFYLGLGALFWTSLSIAGAIWVIAPTLLLGWNPVAISSNSMAPAFHRGDIVIADAPQGDIDVGSVVVFEDPSRDGLLTHRLVGVTLDGTYVTRGDANAATDSTPLAPEAVRGVGRLLVPSVGLPLVWVDEGAWLPFGLWAVLTLVALWAARFALDSRYDPWRERGETSGVGRAPARRGRRQLAPRAVAGALASVMAHSVAAVRTRRSALPSPVAEDHAHEPLVVSIDASVATAEELLALGARLEDHPTTAQVSLSRVGRATARFEITTTDRAAVAELLDSTAGPGEWRVPDDRDAERPARMRHDGFTQPAPNSDHGEPLTLFIDASFAAVQGLLAFGAQIEEHPTTAAVALSRGGRPAARFEIVTNDPAAVVELLDSIVGPQEWHAPDPLHAAQLARAHARRNRRGPSARVAVIATLVASLCGLAIAAEPSLALFGSATGSSGNALAADTLDPPTALAAVPSGSDVSLSWTATVDTYATGYRIYRSQSPVLLANAWTTGLTHVAGAGSNRLLLFVAGMENGAVAQSPPAGDRDLIAVTYGGQALTSATDIVVYSGSPNSFCARNEIWYLAESGIQAASDSTFVPTWSGSAPFELEEYYAAVTLQHVDQASPIGGTSSKGNTTDNPLQIASAIGVAAGDLVVMGATAGAAGSYTASVGYTVSTDQSLPSSTMSTAEKSITSAGSEQPSVTHGGPNRQVVQAVVVRRESDAGFAFLDSVVGQATTSYLDSGVSAGTLYFYRLESYYLNWTSAYSNQASIVAP